MKIDQTKNQGGDLMRMLFAFFILVFLFLYFNDVSLNTIDIRSAPAAKGLSVLTNKWSGNYCIFAPIRQQLAEEKYAEETIPWCKVDENGKVTFP